MKNRSHSTLLPLVTLFAFGFSNPAMAAGHPRPDQLLPHILPLAQ
jgi:hypothetical protein